MSQPNFQLIGIDADDTLWHCQRGFDEIEARFTAMLEPWLGESQRSAAASLHETERRNLEHFGYGVKGFVISLVETAIEISGGKIKGAQLSPILDWGRELLGGGIELLESVDEALEALVNETTALITKGDLFEQESKVAASGLAHHFDHIEIIPAKGPDNYANLLRRLAIQPERFVMIGNSPRSDILPALQVGAWAVHVPAAIEWEHERADVPDHPRLHRADTLHQAVAWVLARQRGE